MVGIELVWKPSALTIALYSIKAKAEKEVLLRHINQNSQLRNEKIKYHTITYSKEKLGITKYITTNFATLSAVFPHEARISAALADASPVRTRSVVISATCD